MFVALAENYGNVRDKLNLYVALAPVVKIDNHKMNFLKTLVNHLDTIEETMWLFGFNELYGTSWTGFASKFCFMNSDWCGAKNDLLVKRVVYPSSNWVEEIPEPEEGKNATKLNKT